MRRTLYYDSNMLYFEFEAIVPSLSPRSMYQKYYSRGKVEKLRYMNNIFGTYFQELGLAQWLQAQNIAYLNHNKESFTFLYQHVQICVYKSHVKPKLGQKLEANISFSAKMCYPTYAIRTIIDKSVYLTANPRQPRAAK